MDDRDGSSSNVPTTCSYFSGDEVLLSEYGNFQAAVNNIPNRGVLLIDEDVTVSSRIDLRSNMKIQGDGGTISVADNRTKTFEGRNVENVWIDGINWDGQHNSHYFGMSVFRGSSKNIRITNNKLSRASGNFMSFRARGSGTLQEDIYVGGNVLRNEREALHDGHGIVWGADNEAEGRNVLFERNRIRNYGSAQGIGFFANKREGPIGSLERFAAVGNEILWEGSSQQKGGHGIIAEGNTHRCVMYGNYIKGPENPFNGLTVSKTGRENLVLRNYAEVNKPGLSIQNYDFYEPSGPPSHNIFARNLVRNSRAGFHLWNTDTPNAVFMNRFENCDMNIRLTDAQMNGYWNNNGGYSGTVGVPVKLGASAQVEASDGSWSGAASWSRGSCDPDNPVRVDVDVRVPREAID